MHVMQNENRAGIGIEREDWLVAGLFLKGNIRLELGNW
jgi:hypothetical protein